MKEIIVPIDIHSYLGYTSDNQEEIDAFVLKTFKMPIPTHAKLNLQPKLIEKMKLIKGFMQEQQLSKVSFLSSLRKDLEHSNIELFYNDTPISISKYEDFDRLFDSFDSRCFSVKCDTIYNSSFVAQIIYVTSWTEFVFSTNHFNID